MGGLLMVLVALLSLPALSNRSIREATAEASATPEAPEATEAPETTEALEEASATAPKQGASK